MMRQTLREFGGCECEYNFCDMARTLRMGENAFRRSCNFRHSVQRNCFEFALYHDCISNRIGSDIRNYPRRRCRHVTFGALPTLSVRDRAIIVLNDHRFWGSFWPFIVRQHAPIVHPLLARPRPTPQPLPRERVRCALGMLSSLEVKVFCPT